MATVNPRTGYRKSVVKRALYHSALYRKSKYKGWKLQWFAVFETRKLVSYADYDSFTQNKRIDIIDLSEVTRISKISTGTEPSVGNYSFELTLSSKTHCLGHEDMARLSRWIRALSHLVFGRVLHSGWMTKSGESTRNRSWKRRWFVLSSFQEMRYHKDAGADSAALGVIKLRSAISIRVGDAATHPKYPHHIEVITADRTWVLVAADEAARQLWMDKLGQAMICTEGHAQVLAIAKNIIEADSQLSRHKEALL